MVWLGLLWVRLGLLGLCWVWFDWGWVCVRFLGFGLVWFGLVWLGVQVQYEAHWCKRPSRASRTLVQRAVFGRRSTATINGTVAALLWRCCVTCSTVATLLWHCCGAVASLLWHCCVTVASLLRHCCVTVAVLLPTCHPCSPNCWPRLCRSCVRERNKRAELAAADRNTIEFRLIAHRCGRVSGSCWRHYASLWQLRCGGREEAGCVATERK